MKKLAIAVVLLLAPAFPADASGVHRHRQHPPAPVEQSRPFQPASAEPGSPVTRLPVAPDAFRA